MDLGDLDRVSQRLDRLISVLAHGPHENLDQAAAELAQSQAALKQLRDAARGPQPPRQSVAALLTIRGKIAIAREMLAHASQVRTGVESIRSLLTASHRGSTYSPQGGSKISHSPRLLAEA